MVKRWIVVSLMLVLMSCVAINGALAASITVGAEIPISATTFALPLQIIGGIEVTGWQFDLSFDPADVQVNEGCDPFTDSYCSFVTFAVTEGSFFAAGQPFNLLNPGFLFIDPGTLQQTGILQEVNGAFGGTPPAPSGDGVIAFVEFLRVGNGTSPITILNPSISSGVNPVPEPATAVLLATGVLFTRARRPRRRAP